MISKNVRRIFLTVTVILLMAMVKIYYDTNAIEIRHYRIETSPLGEALDGLKVLHLSDFHIRTIGVKEKKILEIVKDEKPDLILITGDLIQFEGPYEPAMSFLGELKAPFGVYAVLGNTEYSNANGSCILCHEERSKNLKKKQNPTFLRNSSATLRINGKTLTILGVDDPVSKKSDLRATLRETDVNNPHILLAHSPEIFEEAANLGIDLLLCGHTHGGQLVFIRYLRKVAHLDPALQFLEGFFRKGKTLMYVSKGIGTSYLPFRFMVKPDITFFTFTNDQSRAPLPSSLVISNTPSRTILAGLTISTLIETFNPLRPFSLSLSSTNTNEANQLNRSDKSNTLFDFESESDLKRLDWECHKWFELSKDHVTSGRYTLKVSLPAGQYPGIAFEEVQRNWSQHRFFKMDIFNPSREDLIFHIRIDDRKSGWEYADRFDVDLTLKPGMNNLSIPMDSMKTNIHPHRLDLKNIERLMAFIPGNPKARELYIDNMRLE